MKASPIVSTLFRFAVPRSPEVVAAEPENVTAHPNVAASTIYSAIIGGASPASAAADFENPFDGLDDIRNTTGGGVYNFSIWLAANRNTATKTDVDAKLSGVSALASDKAEKLWDNLYYQSITQESPIIADYVARALVSNNLIDKIAADPAMTGEQVRAFATGALMIPKELSGNSMTGDEYTDNVTPPVFKGNKYIRQSLDIVLATARLKTVQKAIDELRAVKAAYDIIEKEAYAAARRTWNEAVAVVIATKREDAGPNPATFPYTDADFPTFTYTPALEMDPDILAAKLSDETLFLLEQELPDAALFEPTLKNLEATALELNRFIFDTVDFNQQYVVAGGARIPVRKMPRIANADYGYLIQSVELKNKTRLFALVIDTGGETPELASASFEINGIKVEPSQVTEASNANHLGLYFQVDDLTVPSDHLIPFEGEIYLPSGLKFTINDTPVDKAVTPGKPDVDDPDNRGQEPQVSKYGLKRLGLADYLRVDQQICCYVPGEVSHIENIMAKEYKERSTRVLRRSEDTTTTESYSERENMTDTATAEHNEMHNETAKVIAESKATNLGASFQGNYSGTGYSLNLGLNASYATSSNTQTSTNQAASIAKDITYRATERVYSRVSEQRVTKMIDEFEEQNKHGFDNRGDTAENLSGVYRWVDKIYENNLISYGRRLMYEFIIPEPASFHKEAITKSNGLPAGAILLEKPEDPRTIGPDPLTNHLKLTRTNYGLWAAKYGAEAEAPPPAKSAIGKSFSYATPKDDFTKRIEAFADKDVIRIPEGYYMTGAEVAMSGMQDFSQGEAKAAVVLIGGIAFSMSGNFLLNTFWQIVPLAATTQVAPFEREVPVSAIATNFVTFSATANIYLTLTAAAFEQWQASTYAAILSAYEEKLAAYNKAFADAMAKAQDNLRPVNPAFNRQIEAVALRKGCINLLVGPHYPGKAFITGLGNIQTIAPLLGSGLDSYASIIRFMELAFEWEIMSYTYYPFYWGDRKRWSEMYNVESDDELFRSFLQSGMARVICTVRPGFERAVLHYMSTGKVWEGTEPPVYNDDVVKNVLPAIDDVDEHILATWETRVPTTLTVIQDSTVGLEASGLPCSVNCGGEEEEFEKTNRKLNRLPKAEE